MKYENKYDELDASDVIKNKPVYRGICLLNETGKKRVKDMKGARSDLMDRVLQFAYAYEKHYLNEDGDYDLKLDGTPAYEPPSKIQCFNYAKGMVQSEFDGGYDEYGLPSRYILTKFEKDEIWKIFAGR